MKRREPKKTEQAKVFPAGEINQKEELPVPTEEALKIGRRIAELRQELVSNMKKFNSFLSNSVLPENKSNNDKEEESLVITELSRLAQEIDRYCDGEGALAIAVFAMRQSLLLRDAGNRLAYEIAELKEQKVNKQENVKTPIENDTLKEVRNIMDRLEKVIGKEK